MIPHFLFADASLFPHGISLGLVLPVAVGVVAGMGVVGFIHFWLRPRIAAAAAPPKKKEQASVDPFTHGSTSEQRSSFRRKGNPIEVLLVDQAKQGEPMRGQVINRSVGGLCIITDREIEEETSLTVRPTNAPHIAPWVAVIVKNCRRADIGYELGCQFIKTPPWPVLMMFG